MLNKLIGCWLGRITYQNIPCLIIIEISQDIPYICISIPEINIWNIPHYFCNISDDLLEFSLWDNKLIGKFSILNNNINKLILSNVSCIKENDILLNKTDRNAVTNIVCGKFSEIDKYQAILKNSFYSDDSDFDTNVKYKFIFEHPDYMNLHSLLKINKEKFKKHTFDIAISLMRMVHKITASAGISVYIPPHRSGYTLLRQKMKKEIGLNCRGTAIVLNDTLLSMGIYSKFICCMSYDVFDPECHVTNCVYIPEWDKWIMLDSATQTYITDDNGNILNISDVRNRIMDNEKEYFDPELYELFKKIL